MNVLKVSWCPVYSHLSCTCESLGKTNVWAILRHLEAGSSVPEAEGEKNCYLSIIGCVNTFNNICRKRGIILAFKMCLSLFDENPTISFRSFCVLGQLFCTCSCLNFSFLLDNKHLT